MTLSDTFWKNIDDLLKIAIAEDIKTGDITSESIIPESSKCTASFVARQPGVMAGMEVVERFYEMLPGEVTIKRKIQEGHSFIEGDVLAVITGNAQKILTGERIALNILQRMGGIATVTKKYVKAIEGTSAKIVDTRKTVPGWRDLDKLAVYLGGASNHRHGLYDMVLIKDNHIAIAAKTNSIASVAWAVRTAREKTNVKIQVEVDTIEQLKEVISEEPDMILLDNMNPDVLTEAVAITNKICSELSIARPLLEASGGIELGTVRRVAESGVDRISVGALTHSVIALDIGLDMDFS